MTYRQDFFRECSAKIESLPLSFGVEMLEPVISEIRKIIGGQN